MMLPPLTNCTHKTSTGPSDFATQKRMSAQAPCRLLYTCGWKGKTCSRLQCSYSSAQVQENFLQLQIADMIRVHAKPRKVDFNRRKYILIQENQRSLPKVRTCVAPLYKAILVDKWWQKKLLLHCKSACNISHASKVKFFETKNTSKPHSLG